MVSMNHEALCLVLLLSQNYQYTSSGQCNKLSLVELAL